MTSGQIPIARSFVGGEWRDGAPAPDLNPARPSEVVAETRLADAALAAEAAQAARAAFPSWRAMPPPARGEILRRAADVLERRAEDVGREFAREE
ncbi:MAG TPA: aldehyde dehydrogenase family protein, partial [Candidatus Dormibacteraeota bacterium]|nr:aldehyde dehydrogenase family protein [Candidatus Dormibacteraeota bacterium]